MQSDFLISSYDGSQGKKTDTNFQWLVPTQLFISTQTEGENTIFLTSYLLQVTRKKNHIM